MKIRILVLLDLLSWKSSLWTYLSMTWVDLLDYLLKFVLLNFLTFYIYPLKMQCRHRQYDRWQYYYERILQSEQHRPKQFLWKNVFNLGNNELTWCFNDISLSSSAGTFKKEISFKSGIFDSSPITSRICLHCSAQSAENKATVTALEL